MKNSKITSQSFSLIVALLMVGFVLTSCQKDPITPSNAVDIESLQAELPPEADEGEIKMNQQEIESRRDEILEMVNALGVNLDMLEEETVMRPGGKVDHVFTIGGDIEVSRETLMDLRNPGRQYSTNYLVSSPRLITIGVESGSFGHVPAPFMTGAMLAAQNYNNLDIGLTFEVIQVNSDLPNSPNVDILIYWVNNGQSGGKAGFSTNSDPYPYIQIFSGMTAYMNNNNVMEHLITHEIGHCIGLRHTDWQTRKSCGGNNPEAVSSYGANYIPGTDPNSENGSIMQACFSSSTNGEFSIFDVIALNHLY